MEMNKKTQFNIWYWIAAFFLLMAFQYFFTTATQVTQIPYSQFETYLDEGRIAEVAVSDRFIQGTFKQPVDGRPMFITTRVEPDLARQLQERGVVVTGQIESTFLRDLLSWIVPVLLIVSIWMFALKRMGGGIGGGLMQIGKSKAKVYVQSDTGVTFKDVAGVDEAKDELKEIVDFLKDPQGYGRLGGRMPKGVLLVGPPGTGKTLLARAVAGEAGVPFFSISGSEFVEMFVGVGAARVRDLFEQARAKAPAIIFIDELDALGRARGIGPMAGGHDEKEQTLNQLLVELDGFDPSTGLVLLAATNRPEILDPALLRAGRFDRQVLVDRPNTEDRFLMTLEELENKMAVLLGGRAAEKIVFGHLSTGAADDLAKVTDIARAIVTRYGMSERLGHIALEKDRRSFLATDQPYYGPQERTYSDETAAAVDKEVRRIVDETFERTVGLLAERRDMLERTARRLLEKETLDGLEIQELVGKLEESVTSAAV